MRINELLDPHSVIGWDVDGTILDHHLAPAMHRYIREHRQKCHFIVTFRSHGWQHDIFDDLAELHDWFPDKSYFNGVVNLPDAMLEAERLARQTQDNPAHTDIIALLEWKGLVCSQHGITVLIDDMTDAVSRGCDRYGVLHINPDDLA
jgi:hypothetical protein